MSNKELNKLWLQILCRNFGTFCSNKTSSIRNCKTIQEQKC